MRRAIGVLALATLTSCTPDQHQQWLKWFRVDPVGAVAFVKDGCGELSCDVESAPTTVNETAQTFTDEADGDAPDEVGVLAGMTRCPQWADEAYDAGWRNEGETLDRIMWAESRCSASAYNPQEHWGGHASGLLQVVWPTWADGCGWIDIFDPVANLRCALFIRNTQGWNSWITY